MDAVELIRSSLEFNLKLNQRFTADIPEDRMAEQPGVIVNHAAWILGHVALSLYGAAHVLGGPDHVPRGWHDLFGMGSQPTSDRTKYPDKETLLTHLTDAGQLADHAWAAATAEQLATETPIEQMRHIFPTVGVMAAGICTGHFSYHHGQLSVWRKAVGLSRAMPV